MAYTPWSNGAVQVANRDLLAVLKPLLSEMRVDLAEWHTFAPVLQSALNNALITVMLPLPMTRPICLGARYLKGLRVEHSESLERLQVAQIRGREGE